MQLPLFGSSFLQVLRLVAILLTLSSYSFPKKAKKRARQWKTVLPITSRALSSFKVNICCCKYATNAPNLALEKHQTVMSVLSTWWDLSQWMFTVTVTVNCWQMNVLFLQATDPIEYSSFKCSLHNHPHYLICSPEIIRPIVGVTSFTILVISPPWWCQVFIYFYIFW